MLKIEDICKIVCEYYSVTLDELKLKCRKRKYSYPRFVIFYFAEMEGHISTSIADYFKLHHTSILSGIDIIDSNIITYKNIKSDINNIAKIIKLYKSEQAALFFEYIDCINITKVMKINYPLLINCYEST